MPTGQRISTTFLLRLVEDSRALTSLPGLVDGFPVVNSRRLGCSRANHGADRNCRHSFYDDVGALYPATSHFAYAPFRTDPASGRQDLEHRKGRLCVRWENRCCLLVASAAMDREEPFLIQIGWAREPRIRAHGRKRPPSSQQWRSVGDKHHFGVLIIANERIGIDSRWRSQHLHPLAAAIAPIPCLARCPASRLRMPGLSGGCLPCPPGSNNDHWTRCPKIRALDELHPLTKPETMNTGKPKRVVDRSWRILWFIYLA
jgi:hypothetical protein